ncbi:MAG: metallophosphoesterase [Eubacteriales bacterium]|nr:metallophosphoesterase [Eubacteriales bacterium]
MSVYAIADLHLSLGTDKPMDIFSGWSDYVTRLENNWRRLVSDADTVVIAGDVSWAMKLDECYEDFSFLQSLPGKKLLIKGNHDYWWSTKKKMDEYLTQNGFDSIEIVFNNAYARDGIAICGTRGWNYESSGEKDMRILNREIGRLNTSINEAKETGLEPVVFLHYPPMYDTIICKEIIETMKAQGIKRCYYGHLHGAGTHKHAVIGEYEGINFKLISCDYTEFYPVPVA